jgi:hypothetical protein
MKTTTTTISQHAGESPRWMDSEQGATAGKFPANVSEILPKAPDDTEDHQHAPNSDYSGCGGGRGGGYWQSSEDEFNWRLRLAKAELALKRALQEQQEKLLSKGIMKSVASRRREEQRA